MFLRMAVIMAFSAERLSELFFRSGRFAHFIVQYDNVPDMCMHEMLGQFTDYFDYYGTFRGYSFYAGFHNGSYYRVHESELFSWWGRCAHFIVQYDNVHDMYM